MDFSIIQGDNGRLKMSWDKPADITTNIFSSITIKKGSFFSNPDFGLDLSDIRLVTDENINEIKDRFYSALKWLIDSGKAKSVKVEAYKNNNDVTRVDFKLSIVQSKDNQTITITAFKTVGGP